METHGYVGDYSINNIDDFRLKEQYRLLYDLPDGRSITPQVKRRMFYRDERASEAVKHVRRVLPSPFSPNALPQILHDAPSLIDEERWDEARAKLRSEGAFLPCDYMFSDQHRIGRVRKLEAFDSDETIRSAGVDARRRLDSTAWAAETVPLLSHDEEQINIQSEGAIVSRLLLDFGKAVQREMAKLLRSRFAY